MNSSLIQQQKRFINLRLGTFIHFNSATFQFNQGPIKDWEYECENIPFSQRIGTPPHWIAQAGQKPQKRRAADLQR